MYDKTNFIGGIIIRNNPALNNIKNCLIPSSDRRHKTIKVRNTNFRKTSSNNNPRIAIYRLRHQTISNRIAKIMNDVRHCAIYYFMAYTYRWCRLVDVIDTHGPRHGIVDTHYYQFL